YLHIGAEACNVLACGRVNVENPIVVIVSDTYHNPVRDGTVVYFTTDKGTVRGQRSGNLGSDFTVDGVGGALWLSGSSCETVTVTASTAAGGVTNSVAFLASDDPYSATILSPSSDVVSLPADGESRFTMWVEVLDVFGTYVLPAGIEVEAEFGSIPEQGESGDGCHSSVARVIYQSKTLDRDYSVTTPDDGVGAVDNVTVSTGYGGAGDQIQVELLTSGANRDESKLELQGSVTAGGAVQFTVSLADRYGNPLGGHTFEASVSAGSVSTIPATDTWGTSTGTFFAPDAAGNVTLTVVDTDPNYGGLVLALTIPVQ
ncbi:MAG: hypothetical protein KC729_12230, partial [Candidatus Eisenbacteria bacterium]|nr:hypothetical protein [Candidatus Eisenbacteria bacterium]